VVEQTILEEIPTEMHRYQYNIFQNLADYLVGNGSFVCDGGAGLSTIKVLEKTRGGYGEF